MPAPALALARRTVSHDTGRRKVEVPVDALGRERWRARIDSSSVEQRADDANEASFEGHAALFDKRTWIGPKKWGFWERVAKGAFKQTLSDGADVRFLVNHDPNLLMARTKSGTLTLSEDSDGLLSKAGMDRRQTYTNDVVIALERGDISQMSFAFEVVKDSWEELDDGNELRTLEELRLWDVSVVTYPAYEDTDAGLRGAAFDVLCRSAGLDSEAQDRLLLRIADQIAGGDPPDAPEPGSSTRDDTSQPGSSTGAPTARDISTRFRSRPLDGSRITSQEDTP